MNLTLPFKNLISALGYMISWNILVEVDTGSNITHNFPFNDSAYAFLINASLSFLLYGGLI